jgi:excinuclease UvrABC ATPase subunit
MRDRAFEDLNVDSYKVTYKAGKQYTCVNRHRCEDCAGHGFVPTSMVSIDICELCNGDGYLQTVTKFDDE